MYEGFEDNEGRTYFRCPDCGDSKKNPRKAHAFYDKEGKTRCWKCGTEGEISLEAMIALMQGGITVDEALEWQAPEMLFIQHEGRPTLLEKYQHIQGADTFTMRDHLGNIIGLHHRLPNKHFSNEGRRGIDYVGSKEMPLVSTPSEPLVLVEGPYDVIRPNYVSCFGLITRGIIRKFFRQQYLWVFPDPDQLETSLQRRKLVDMLTECNENFCTIMGIIIGNADPDEATILKHRTLEEARAYVQSEMSQVRKIK